MNPGLSLYFMKPYSVYKVMIQNDGARNIKMYLCKDKRPTSWNIRRGLIYFFLLILWKFGFIGWLEVMP